MNVWYIIMTSKYTYALQREKKPFDLFALACCTAAAAVIA